MTADPSAALPATLLIIGDEILAGEIADRNGPWLAEQLAAEGWRVRELRILPDDVDDLVAAIRAAESASRLVILCGGLGPTSDDVTTEAVARAHHQELRLDDEAWSFIRSLFEGRGLSLPESNKKQALFPADAEVLPNLQGTAPGHLTRGADAWVAVLPGPPRENRAMYEHALRPRLREGFPDAPRWRTRLLRVFGLGESTVGEKLGELTERFPAVRLGFQARFPEILVKLRHDTVHTAEAEAAEAYVLDRLAPFVYGVGETLLPEVLGRACAERGLTLATAESCTAGLAAKLLTDVPGSSAWMERGFVTYTNAAKVELLGVPEALLAEHGAVSEPVAEAMARGALERSPADLAIAITGIAGPDGGTTEKPVGTVCLAWGDRSQVQVKTQRFPFDRDHNRTLSAWAAFGRLYRFLQKRDA